MLWISAFLLAAAAPFAAAAQLANDLNSIVRNAALGQGGVAGVSVVDLNTGATIFEHRADEPMVPASNMKLLTSAAAVKIHGPE